MQGLLEQAGARPQKEPRFTPLVIERAFTGLVTQRSYLHDPSELVIERFYGGRPDTLWDGANVELTNALVLARRPGLSAFSVATYPTAPSAGFSFHLPDGTIQVLIDTSSAVYWDQQNGSKTLIYTKQAGARQAHFVESQAGPNGVCYIGDGKSLIKYTPGNVNGTTWNWGIAAPTSAPQITTIQVGSSAPAWQASTVFSTMGLLVDANNNIQSLNAVNLNGNTSQTGTSGTGQPPFSTTYNGTFTETSGTPIVWKCFGQLTQWQASTFYNFNQCVYDPITNCVFANVVPAGATSGTVRPKFPSTLGAGVFENANIIPILPTWVNIGFVGGGNGSPNCEVWMPSTSYTQFNTNKFAREIVLSPVLATSVNTSATTTQPIFVQASQTTGTSGNSYTPSWATTKGLPTADGNLQWICLGSKTWAASTAYTQWTAGQTVFSVLEDSNNLLWVCIQGGTSGTLNPFPSTAANYGDKVNDGPVIWVCVGPAITWTASQKWYMPVGGFAPPSSVQPYGGAFVKDSNNNIQYVTVSGLSGASAPTWSTNALRLNDTTDNNAKWTMTAAFSSNSMSWTSGHNYAISYKCRATNDPYVTTGLLQSLGSNTNNLLLTAIGKVLGLTEPLGPYVGGGTGAVSSTSPILNIAGASATGGVVNQVTIQGSPDPQCDTIILWRDADGGGPSNMFELVEIPNPPIVNGIAGTAVFNDFLPDVASTVNGVQYPGLNISIPAPINNVNNPPPAGYLPMIPARFERIWGVSGGTVSFSGGPDTLVGNSNEAFNAADSFTYNTPVIRLVDTPAALLVFLSGQIQSILGGPATASFFPGPVSPGIGLGNYNALDIHAGEIYFMSSDSQFYAMTPGLQLANLGFNIGDKLAAFNSASVYVTFHQSGIDSAIYIADGSTGWYRLNPHQVPQNDAVWSPKAIITGGAKMVQSLEISPGVFRLLVGGTGTNQSILKRDPAVFTDSGTSFDAWFWLGALWLARSGQIAALSFVECDFTNIGSVSPIISVLLNEVSGTFTGLPTSVSDPPLIYGAAGAPATLQMNRYYMNQAQAVARCKFMGIKVDFGSDTTQSTLHDLTVYGALFSER